MAATSAASKVAAVARRPPSSRLTRARRALGDRAVPVEEDDRGALAAAQKVVTRGAALHAAAEDAVTEARAHDVRSMSARGGVGKSPTFV
jgi:hypothetical protein